MTTTKQSVVHAVLHAYSDLNIDAQEAMAALGLCCLEDLYAATRAAGLPLPQIEAQHAEMLADRAMRPLTEL